jgi:hypothetical protein
MSQRVFHVVGTTQYNGTCRFHLFCDCPQLIKKRVQQMSWGVRDSTGAIVEEAYEVSPRRVCKICARRKEALAVASHSPASASEAPSSK